MISRCIFKYGYVLMFWELLTTKVTKSYSEISVQKDSRNSRKQFDHCPSAYTY